MIEILKAVSQVLDVQNVCLLCLLRCTYW